MLTHTIAPYAYVKPTRHQQMHRFDGELGSDRHREYIFARSIRNCKFEVGEHVLYKRNRYDIVNIEMSYHSVLWDGLTPLYIDIWDGHNSMLTVHPGVLSRRK